MEETLKKVEENIPELLGGKKDKEKVNTIAGELQLNIKAYISENSDEKFFSDVAKIGEHLDKDIKYVVILLYLQIGKPDKELNKVFEYKNKNDARLCLQLKIKSYIPFKSKESAEIYMIEELTANDLAMLGKVDNGVIVI